MSTVTLLKKYQLGGKPMDKEAINVQAPVCNSLIIGSNPLDVSL
ncbi:hypothetical protein [Kineothrix sp. MB12-C1]|nr:hypothetical protein [Kineothrix sp. MB12-C1]WMC94189.1 hypothetical protein RBB56_07965 [Kineothrix sp. MB12-C1]